MNFKSRLGTIEDEIEAARRYLDTHPDPNDRVLLRDRLMNRFQKVRDRFHALNRLHAQVEDEEVERRRVQFPEESYETSEARVRDGLLNDPSYRARQEELDRLDKVLDAIRDERERLDEITDKEKEEAAKRLLLLPFAEQMARTEKFQSESDREIANTLYFGTVLSMKPDRHGRYYLMDIRFDPESNETWLVLSGTEKVIYLAGVYVSRDERFERDGETYYRQHGLPGARIMGGGYGALAYMGSALACSVFFNNIAGTASVSGGRSETADALWESFAKKRVTVRRSEAKKKAHRETVCLPFPKEKRAGTFRVKDQQTRKWVMVNGRVERGRRRLCEEDVRYSYTIPGRKVNTDYLRGDAVLLTPFYVFGPMLDTAADPEWRKPLYFASRWRVSHDTGVFESYPNPGYRDEVSVGPRERIARLGREGALTRKGLAPAITKQATAEMLARAYHGDSPGLINYIMMALQANGWDEQAQLYHDRPDIIAAIQKHNELAFYRYGKAATPLSSLRGLGQTGSAIPPLPATIAREIESYALPDGGTE